MLVDQLAPIFKLDDLLKYENKHVIVRYQRDYPNAKMPGSQAFSELLKYIWLCLKHQREHYLDPNNTKLHFKCVMHKEMSDIDNMWHTFLLFTKDYHEFCHQYLQGIFFHHEPTRETQDKKNLSPHKYAYELNNYLIYIYDNLGEQTLKLWFAKYL